MLLFFTLSWRTITIVRRSFSRDLRTRNYYLFAQDVFKTSHKTDRILFQLRVVFTHDWSSRVALAHDWLNSNLITIACSVLPFISDDQQSDECIWRRMFLPSRNLYKCKQAVYWVFYLRSSLNNCFCYLSAIFFILHFVIACLCLCPIIFFFLHWRCYIFVYSVIM